MEIINIITNKEEEFIDITNDVIKCIKKLNINNGGLIIFCPHTTAGLTINENADPSVKSDIINALNVLPFDKVDFKHMEGNSISHIKATLMGSSLNLIVDNGELLLGTWQGIFFCEFDGPRNRKVYVSKI